jgi:hypothetical protein
MKNIIIIAMLTVLQTNCFAQTDAIKKKNTIRYESKPRLILDVPLFDFSQMNIAAKMNYNKRNNLIAGGNTSPNFNDYLTGLTNPSMQQALAVTKNLHTTNYYFNNRLWNKLVPVTSKKNKFFNRLGAQATSGIADYILSYKLVIFGPVWLHEEFHRNNLTACGVPSCNATNKRFSTKDVLFGIDNVRDADLAWLKNTNAQTLVRSFAAGIEAQYEFTRNMRKDNFYKKTNYANIVMNILITKQAVDYVNQFKVSDYDASIDSINKNDGANIKKRDFTGWDFTAWVYDLHRQDKPYTRTPHPSGVGVQRSVKRSELSAEDEAYLTKMGKLSYINFLSPSMLGISAIPTKWGAFSFAGRHLLNSFGYDVGADIFLDIKGQKYFISLHGYKNESKFLPGIEIEKPDLKFHFHKKEIPVTARLMLWLQPKDQLFKATKAEAGGLLQVRGNYPVNKTFSVFAECEAKTKGWVAGNPYLNSNLSLRTGLYFDFK